jgi:hypothetical protein
MKENIKYPKKAKLRNRNLGRESKRKSNTEVIEEKNEEEEEEIKLQEIKEIKEEKEENKNKEEGKKIGEMD